MDDIMDGRRLPPPSITDTGYSEDPASVEQASSLASLLSGSAGTWITFRSDFDVNLDGPYSNDFTPHAIYGMDAARTASFAEAYARASEREREWSVFHNIGYVRRPVAIVFTVEGRTISASDYADQDEDWRTLRSYLEEQHPDAVRTADVWRPKQAFDPRMGFKWLMWITEKCADDIVGAEPWGDTFKYHPEKPRLWRELLAAIGIDAVEDRIGFLTGDSDHQIAVVNPKSIRVVDSFHNPAAAIRRNVPGDEPTLTS